jgi:glycosyltransferase involved in cell wall biosynthesis
MDASIIVNTHNHGPYVEQCLYSLLNQVTGYSLEIIWYDDASTDDTLIKGEQALANCMLPVHRLHYQNNRKRRRIPTLLDKLELCRGRYIFWIEGDDFWLSMSKLQIQIDALDQMPDLNICFTPAQIFNGTDIKPGDSLGNHSRHAKIFTLNEVIVGDGGFMPTASLCIRREVYDDAPDWLYGYMPVGDFPMQVLAAMKNGALFLPEFSCAYRMNVNQSWTQTVYNRPEKRLIFELEFLEMLWTMLCHLPDQASAFKELAMAHYKTLQGLSLQFGDWHTHQRGGLLLQKILQR